MDLYRMLFAGQAQLRLKEQYAKVAVFREGAATAPTSSEYNRYMRRALKCKAIGIVEHDRIINGKGVK